MITYWDKVRKQWRCAWYQADIPARVWADACDADREMFHTLPLGL